MLFWLSVIALGVVGALAAYLYRQGGPSRIDAIARQRGPTSRLVTSGEFVDGSRHLKVALALTDTVLFYEDSDVQAYLDLQWITEIDYDTRLATGHAIEHGKVLRIRCNSQLFEFILPDDVVPAWQAMLPSRRAIIDVPDVKAAIVPVAVAL